MSTLLDMSTDVRAWLSSELSVVDCLLKEHLESRHAAVNDVCQHLSRYRGKMLRPSLVLLSWRCVRGDGDVPEDVHRAAAVVELIHLATLVHDDVLDESDIRRGGQTINSLWGNEGAVILGDYLLSSAFHLCSTIRSPELNILLGEVTNTLCGGELVQLYHRNNLALGIDDYFQIIHDKTASLISASCKIGGLLGEADEETVESLGFFGHSIGTAFQIRDDLIDILSDECSVGKPTGKDVAKGKMTLPSIILLSDDPRCSDKLQMALGCGDLVALRALMDGSSAFSSTQETISGLVDNAIDSIGAFRHCAAGNYLVGLARQISEPV